MMMRGEITCLNCGRFLGELEGEVNRSIANALIWYCPCSPEVRRAGSGLRCGYCGGKAIVEVA